MAWDITKILASGVIVGGVAIGTVAFTGSGGLSNIGDTAESFKNKITNLDQSLTNWKDGFNNLKAEAQAKLQDAQNLLNTKNGLVASLKEQVADLESQVASGLGDADILTQEIERLNAEINKANAEIEALETEVAGYALEVEGMGNEVETVPTYTLNGVVDDSTQAEPYNPTPESESVGNTGTEEPIEEPVNTFDLGAYLSPENQTNLTTSTGITSVTNIEKENSMTIAVTGSGFNYQTASLAENKQTFKSSVAPDLADDFGVDSYGMYVKVYDETGKHVATFNELNASWTQIN